MVAFRDALVHDAFDRRHLAPVVLVRLHDHFDARLLADELVGAETDRVLLEAVGADLLEVVFRGDPAGGARQRAVERHEIRPRLMQHEPHLVRVDDHDLLHLLVQLRPFRALEAEHHVLGGERVAVVEFHALAQGEFVVALVLALVQDSARLGAMRFPGIGFTSASCSAYSTQNGVRIAWGGLPRVQPGRRHGHVKRKPHLAFGFGLAPPRGPDRRAIMADASIATEASFCHRFIVFLPCGSGCCRRGSCFVSAAAQPIP